MRQFDVFPNTNPRSARQRPFLVVLQHDRVRGMRSVVTAPCADTDQRAPSTHLSPVVSIEGRSYFVMISELSAISTESLTGRPIGNVAGQSYEIQRALDFLFTGA